MVMHARKQPRLRDGYHEEKESQFYQYPTRDNHVDHYKNSLMSQMVKTRDGSPPRKISPRYYSKQSYHERHANRTDRAMSPSTRKLNHQASIGSKSSHSDNVHHAAAYANQERSAREQKLQQMLKSAKRVHGDWSEHVSSSGKRYYYNCKTEVSQWEKPRDWPDSWNNAPVIKQDDKQKDRARFTNSTSNKPYCNDRMQHSSSNDRPERDRHQPTIGADNHNENRDDSNCRNSVKTIEKPGSSATAASKYSVLTSKSVDMNTRINRTSAWLQNLTADDPNQKTPELDGLNSYAHRERRNSGRSVDLHIDDDSLDTDDMDISPGHTPSSLPRREPYPCTSSIAVITATGHTTMPTSSLTSVISSLPQLIHKLSDGNKANNQNLTQQAIQTLQKLQEAISKQVSQTVSQPSGVQSSTCTQNDIKSPHYVSLKSPHHHGTNTNHVSAPGKGETDDDRAGHTPKSERSHRSGSPALGCKDQSVGMTSALANAPIRPPSFDLTPSLANYYNESLLSHVEHWPAQHVERQVSKVVEESIAGSQKSNKLCAELKNARSLVRIAEIQSTLHEQRLLFLSQHSRELETSKIHSGFMST